jgi:hypothetical protein
MVLAIHVLLYRQGVDARDKRGHDGGACERGLESIEVSAAIPHERTPYFELILCRS